MGLLSGKTRIALRAGIFAFSSLAILPALAGTSYSWTPQGKPAGGIVSKLLIDPSHTATLYALGNNGVYKSTDSGAAWTQVLTALPGAPLDLAIDPQSPATLYVCGEEGAGLQKSADGGQTWTEADSGITLSSGNPDTPASVTVDPVSEGVLYAGSFNSGVYKSSNGGRSWHTINTGLSGLVGAGIAFVTIKVTVDPSNHLNLFLAVAQEGGSPTPAGVYTSTDGGSHWSQPLAGTEVESVAVDPNNDQNVYAATGSAIDISTDGGSTWGVWAHSLSGTHKLVIDASDSNHMFALTSSGLSETPDGGTTWNLVATGLPALGAGTVEVMDLAIDPAAPSHVYLGSYGFGTYKSTDGGVSWKSSDSGLTALGFNAMASDGKGDLYLGTASSGVLKSGDKGATWGFFDDGFSTFDGYLIGSLVPDTAARTTLYAVSSSSTALYKTTNGGASWSRLEVGGFAAAIAPTDDQTVYYGNGSVTGGMAKSIDGGSTWSVASTGLGTNVVTAVAVDPANSDIVFAGTGSGGLFRTTDGGGSWQPAGTGLPTSSPAWVTALAIDPADPKLVYVSFANHDIYKSIDGGSTWKSSSKGMASEEVISSIQISDQPAAIYVLSNTGDLYQSTDAGAEWSAISTTGSGTSFTPAAVMPVPGKASDLYAAGTDGSVYLYSPVTTSPSGGGSSGGGGGGMPSSGGSSGGGGVFPLLGSLLLLGFALRRRRH
jgi:photosystem II stability/assembly factor-like uncharacterized protein